MSELRDALMNLDVEASPSPGRGSIGPSAGNRLASQLGRRAQTPRAVVRIGGEERPIRLDLRDGDAEKLSELCREVRHSALTAASQEVSRRVKLATLDTEIEQLQSARTKYSFEVTGWPDDSWRNVNVEKRRSPQHDRLHRVMPEQRRRELRAIESKAHDAWSPILAAREATLRPEEVARSPLSSPKGLLPKSRRSPR